jgi:hypothetical protein
MSEKQAMEPVKAVPHSDQPKKLARFFNGEMFAPVSD